MSRVCDVLEQKQEEQKEQEAQVNEGGALVPIDGASDDGWGGAAAEASSRWIQGSLLLFADWQWTIGAEKTIVEKGRKLVAVGVRSVWVKWENKKPVEHRTASPGHLLPSRESLGDLDDSAWEKDPRGEAKDPWANTRYVYMLDARTAEALTFSTHSVGGRRCVEDLALAIDRMRRAHPGATPVVELDAAAMPTPHGRKSKPVLKVTDWRVPRQQTIEAAAAPTLAPPTDDMNDSIPF